MPKIFMSYRRKSWPFTHRLADELTRRLDAELFVDYTGVDQADFEESILGHLRTSDALLLVITDLTFADRIHKDDDWVRREIREALGRRMPIVLVCVEGLLPPAGLPDDIKDIARMQGINFYPEYFTPAVEQLAEFLGKIGVAGERRTSSAPHTPAPTQSQDQKRIGGKPSFDEAIRLLDEGDTDKALFLLEVLKAEGYRAAGVLDTLIGQARDEQAKRERRRQAQLDYEDIRALAAARFTQVAAKQAWLHWEERYPDLVAELDVEGYQLKYGTLKVVASAPLTSRVPSLLPAPFAWIEIPAGQVTLVTEKGWAANYIPEGQSRTISVARFAIAKYPVTNAQFRLFIDAGGYREQRWWTAAGWEARGEEKWTEPRYWRVAQWNGAEQSVVGVSWYEAAAFCAWLTETSGEPVRLPGEDEWQRAAQGDDGREYPWGNEWDGSRCNNSVSPHKSDRTTPVTQYEGKGDSPFGVVDMAGNVWEWCRMAYQTGSEELHGTDVRVLRGGSWDDIGTVYFRCDFRGRFDPRNGDKYGGFRLALS